MAVVIVVVPEFVTAERMVNAVHKTHRKELMSLLGDGCHCLFACHHLYYNLLLMKSQQVLAVQQPGQCRAALRLWLKAAG